jgi:hypothetical protein
MPRIRSQIESKTMTENDNLALAGVISSSETVGYTKAKMEIAERIIGLHTPSEIAAELILWLKESKKAD